MNLNELIRKYDKEDYLGRIKEFPEQCVQGWRIGNEFNARKFKGKRFDKILVSGMGGSGYSGYLLQNLLREKEKQIVWVNNYYELPAWVDKKTLVVAISYSGNTEETLASVKEAKCKRIHVLGICSGGKLQRIVGKHNTVLVPSGIQPRQATGYLFFSMLAVLRKLKLVKTKEKEILELKKFLRKEFNGIEKTAKGIAKQVHGNIPVVYVTEELKACGLRWQQEFNEIGKQFLHWNVLPEMQHNEINAFKGFEKGIFFILHRKNEGKQMKKRIKFQEKLVKELRKTVILVEGKGRNLLEELWYVNLLGTLSSFYLAMLNKKNPTPVPVIEELKRYSSKQSK